MTDSVADLLAYIDRSPTPYHAAAETGRRLQEAGFRPTLERETWDLESGDQGFLIRGEGSLVAFAVGTESPASAGFRIVGAHTDSPNLRLKPCPDVQAHGYRQLGMEVYGGVLLHSWLDRDLSLAGRVTIREGDETRTLLLDFERPLLRIPNLAIHLQQELRTDGLKLNPQTHAVPLIGLEDGPPLVELVVSELRARGLAEVSSQDVLAWDLMAYDVQPSAVVGARGEFIMAPRLDNLASCHAGLCALLGGESPPEFTRVLVLYDHEEVGSRSAQGAAGPLLADVLGRLVAGFKGGEAQGLERALASSVLVSADMAHAVHPNFSDRHEPQHRPVLGRGPVLKHNVNQSYASDARTSGLIELIGARAGVDLQHFVSRNDQGCGSTVGPITAARVGVASVDVGNPMLSMHSCREMAGSSDVQPMIDLLERFYRG